MVRDFWSILYKAFYMCRDKQSKAMRVGRIFSLGVGVNCRFFSNG